MQLRAQPRERSPLSAETRLSALLIGGALGLMSLVALALLFATSWLAR